MFYRHRSKRRLQQWNDIPLTCNAAGCHECCHRTGRMQYPDAKWNNPQPIESPHWRPYTVCVQHVRHNDIKERCAKYIPTGTIYTWQACEIDGIGAFSFSINKSHFMHSIITVRTEMNFNFIFCFSFNITVWTEMNLTLFFVFSWINLLSLYKKIKGLIFQLRLNTKHTNSIV